MPAVKTIDPHSMKIYTRTGDEGDTGLFGGARVKKNHPRIAAYGTVDETNAFVGMARVHRPAGAHGDRLDTMLGRIQHELFVVGADLATPDDSKARVPRIGPEHVAALEADIDAMETDLAPLRQFILPGGTACAAALHAARTVCRRAERETVAAMGIEEMDARVMVYLNRLSDLLFVAARWANHVQGAPDIPWTP